jgi:hypothetical protein
MAANDSPQNGGPAGAEKINTEIITLTRFLTEEQVKHKEATGDFTYDPSETRQTDRKLTGCAGCCATRSSLLSRASRTTFAELP